MNEAPVVEFKCPRSNENPHGAGRASHWRDDHTCSYCGSLSEAELFAAIERGEELGPTDKSYKVYVGSIRKFYFQHLSDEGQLRFIELLNAQKIVIGIPGRFYVTPFFICYKKDAPV